MDPREETQAWLTVPPSERYHRVRTPIREQNAGFAAVVLEEAKRHQNGISCRTPSAHKYDANGYKRWCIDCGAELGERSHHPDGADVPAWGVGLFIFLLGLIVLTVVLLGAAWNGAFDGPLPTSTPTTYGPPPTVVP